MLRKLLYILQNGYAGLMVMLVMLGYSGYAGLIQLGYFPQTETDDYSLRTHKIQKKDKIHQKNTLTSYYSRILAYAKETAFIFHKMCTSIKKCVVYV